MSRPRGDHAARRAEIAAAAARAIAAHGLERVTLRGIAATLGVSTGVLTHYFPSKDALVAFTKEWTFDRRFARAKEAAARATGLERVHAVVAELLPVDAERRNSWRLLLAFHGHAVGSAELRRAHDRRMRRWFDFFDAVVAEATGASADASAKARDGMAIALLVEGMAIHLAMMEPSPSRAWQLAFARQQVERLVQPVATRGAPPAHSPTSDP